MKTKQLLIVIIGGTAYGIVSTVLYFKKSPNIQTVVAGLVLGLLFIALKERRKH